MDADTLFLIMSLKLQAYLLWCHRLQDGKETISTEEKNKLIKNILEHSTEDRKLVASWVAWLMNFRENAWHK